MFIKSLAVDSILPHLTSLDLSMTKAQIQGYGWMYVVIAID